VISHWTEAETGRAEFGHLAAEGGEEEVFFVLESIGFLET
jgi:hypothetical protein